MVQRKDLCFSLEAGEALWISRERIRDHLQSIGPFERRVVRSPDATHVNPRPLDPDSPPGRMLGRAVYLDGVPYTVVEIMAREFRTQFADRRWVFWTPDAGSNSRERERQLGYEVVARLAPGASVDQARQEIETIASSIKVEGWGTAGRRLGLVPLRDEVVRNRAHALQLLLAAVVVLAIACANIAQLLLARSDARLLREFATRKALGARSSRVFRLALFESLLLSLAGGVAGVVFAYWLVPTLLAVAPAGIPRLADAAVDGRVLAMALVTSLLTGCSFGVAPARRLSRLSLTETLKPVPGLASKQRARLRSALLMLQVAAAVTLLARWSRPADIPDVVPVIRRFRDGIT